MITPRGYLGPWAWAGGFSDVYIEVEPDPDLELTQEQADELLHQVLDYLEDLLAQRGQEQ